MRAILFMLLLLPSVLFGYDVLRGKPTDEASEGLVIVLFTQIDSVDGRTLYGQRVTVPDSLGVRDTIPWQITVNWERVDTLRGETLVLDTTTVQMRQKYMAGVLRPVSYAIGSSLVAKDKKEADSAVKISSEAISAVAADSVWKAER